MKLKFDGMMSIDNSLEHLDKIFDIFQEIMVVYSKWIKLGGE